MIILSQKKRIIKTVLFLNIINNFLGNRTRLKTPCTSTSFAVLVPLPPIKVTLEAKMSH